MISDPPPGRTDERILVLRVRLRGTPQNARTRWDDDASRKLMDLLNHHAVEDLFAVSGWTASVESIEIEPEPR